MKTTNKNTPRYIAGFFLILITIVTSYLVYTHPHLNMAALFNAVVTGDDTKMVYVPGYEADMGEEGVIEIKAKGNIQAFDALSFLMTFDPAQALTFDADAIVFDNQTLFQDATVKKSTLKQPGQLEVTIVLNDPVTVSNVITADVSTHKTLFKLNTALAENLTDGQKLNVSFKDFAVKNGNSALNLQPIPATTITAKAPAQSEVLADVSIASVTPNAISNKVENNLAVSGTRLDKVKKVWIGTTPATIVNQSATSMTLKVVSGLKVDTYDLVLFDENDKSVSFNDLLTVSDSQQQNNQEASPEAPKIIIDKAYTNPTAAVNDGKTPLTLYAFIEDADIKSVVANLTNIGQVGPENGGVLGEEKNEDLKVVNCPTDSNVIVCMKASVKEGSGQWFMLSNITVSQSATASQTPYQVEVMAIDQKGNATSQMIPVYVGQEVNTAAPKALVAVPNSETSLEILFSKEMDQTTVLPANFSISNSANVNEKLAITNATLDTSGKIVTLTTSAQVSQNKYNLTLLPSLKDLQGKSLAEDVMPLSFQGFSQLNKAPVLDYISTLDSNLLELEFQYPLKLSSTLNLRLKIYEAEAPEKELKVQGIKLSSNNLIQIETENQTSEKRYRIEIEGLQSYDGTALPVAINKGFKGYNSPLVHHAANSRMADLNNDGKVDFADFTIFSSVYGTVYEGEDENISDEITASDNEVEAETEN